MKINHRLIPLFCVIAFVTLGLVFFVYFGLDLFGPSESLEADPDVEPFRELSSLDKHGSRKPSPTGQSSLSDEEDMASLTETRTRTRIDSAGDQCFGISGRVVMKNGDPIPPDIRITCITKKPPLSFLSALSKQRSATPGFLNAKELSEALTLPVVSPDPEGYFLLKGLPEKKLFLFPLHSYLRSAKDQAVQPYILRNDDEKSAQQVILELEEGGVLEGMVLKPDGKPAESATVTLKDEFGLHSMFSKRKGVYFSYTIVVPKEGGFRFEQVPANHQMIIEAYQTGYAPNRKKVMAKAGCTIQIEVLLQLSSMISGVVEDELSNPCPDVEVKLLKSSTNIFLPQSIVCGEKTTTKDGKFSFIDLAAGKYTVQLFEPGFVREAIHGILVSAGERVQGLKLALHKGLSISCTVKDDAGKPIKGAGVKISKTSSSFNNTDRTYARKGTSDSTGYICLSGLEKGAYDLEVTADGYSPFQEKNITAGTEDYCVVLKEGGIISGVAISGINGDSLQNYTIYLQFREKGGDSSYDGPFGLLNKLANRSEHPIKDEKGNFYLSNLAPGCYELTFKADGFSSTKIEGLELRFGESICGITAVLPGESSISGTVKDALTGKPIEEACISLKAGMEGMYQGILEGSVAYTDVHGNFRLGALSAGPLRLFANHPQYKETSIKEIVLLENEAFEEVEIFMSGGSVIKGHVLTADQSPVHGASLIVTKLTGSETVSATTDEDGYYEVRGLSRGSYNVTMSDKMDVDDENLGGSMSNNTQSQNVELGEDQEIECNFIVGDIEENGTSVTGVVQEKGQPVIGAIMQLLKTDSSEQVSPHKMTSTDKEGKYGFTGVQPGDYTVRIACPPKLNVGVYSNINFFQIKIPAVSHFGYDINLSGGAISGIVRDRKSHAPLKSIHIVLQKSNPDGKGDFLSRSTVKVTEAFTVEDGRFEITNLPEGTYTLLAGGSSPVGDKSRVYSLHLMKGIAIGKDEHKEGICIELDKGGGTLEGRVTDLQMLPISDAFIRIQIAGQDDAGYYAECITDSTGFYRYSGLNFGKYDIAVTHDGLSQKKEYNVWIENEKITTMNITLDQ